MKNKHVFKESQGGGSEARLGHQPVGGDVGVGCVEGGMVGGDITPSRIRVKGMGGLWWVTKGDAPVGVAAVVAVAAVAAAAVAATPNIPNSTRVAETQSIATQSACTHAHSLSTFPLL